MADPIHSSCAARVLVVDDDPVQGAIVSSVCTRLGYRPDFASSYQAAAAQIVDGCFDVITIDLSLGDRDGIELLRLIASGGKVPRRLIVISGCDERILNATVRMAHAAGIVDAVSIPKPINLSLLREALTVTAAGDTAPRRLFDPSAEEISIEHLSDGFAAGEISAAFQPKVKLATGQVVGCEALARWDSPVLGAIGPDLFIPLAERSALIKPITLKMLYDSMAFAAQMLRIEPAFGVAVNLSATLLSDTALPEQIEQLLEQTGAPARSLMIEVTESTAMADVARAMDVLLRLRIKGVGISMDDFGTGYSSLSALARMPFSELKIDRSFVKDCRFDADMWKVVSSSVAIAHQYNMTAVAEGIEDAATWDVLNSIGCDVGQGYQFADALKRDAFIDWHRSWTRRLGTPEAAKAAARQA